MCWRCGPRAAGEDGKAFESAMQRAAHKVLWDDGLSRRRILQAGLGFLALPATQILQACATTPITGRSQLRLISEEEEAKLGVTAFAQMRDEEVKKGRLLTEREDPAAHAMVKRISERVIAASGLGSAYKWDYMLLNAPDTVNAAAIAGGRIIVYTGILPVAKTDAGLATILGHEVGHVMAHHTAERFSQDQLVNVAGAVAGASGGGNLATLAVLGLGQVGFLLPYSRAQESEADYIGVLLMAKAGYDPRESVGLWQRMSQGGGSRGPEYLSTHPNPETRITQLQGWMPQALQYYQNPNLALPSKR
ncbi:MAG: zn-dependent protease with chaperone function [candidate division NC10 bacterium]|nr:zn-dependent protease with chaperone function [candidate division NC10 bacterium]